jgi:hypothetical protein
MKRKPNTHLTPKLEEVISPLQVKRKPHAHLTSELEEVISPLQIKKKSKIHLTPKLDDMIFLPLQIKRKPKTHLTPKLEEGNPTGSSEARLMGHAICRMLSLMSASQPAEQSMTCSDLTSLLRLIVRADTGG